MNEEIMKAGFYKNWYDIAKSITAPVEQLAFYNMIMAYTFEGIEPSKETSFLLRSLFLAIKPNIDADVNRKKGGAPKGNQNAVKKQPENNLKTTVETTETNEEEEEVEVEGEEEVVVSPSPLKNKIKNLFQEAELPIEEETELQQGIEALKKSMPTVNDEDLVKACENYISVTTSGKCWFRGKYSFSKFIKQKRFPDFLPKNFRIENFLKDGEKPPNIKKKHRFIPVPAKCSNCGESMTEYSRYDDKHCFCKSCSCEFELRENSWAMKTSEQERIAN